MELGWQREAAVFMTDIEAGCCVCCHLMEKSLTNICTFRRQDKEETRQKSAHA